MTSIPKALIFDYGGVIEGPVDEAGFRADITALAAQYGFRDGRELWHHLYISSAWEEAKRGKISRDAFWEDRLSALGLQTKDKRDEFIHLLHQHRDIRPEMRNLLSELHSACRLAILSNTARLDFALYLSEKRSLAGLFEVVTSSAEVGLAKPDPEIYLLTLKRLNLPPGEALFIDDLVRNTTAADELGMASILFTNPTQLRTELATYGILI
jgi:epoxide hydrolase-like predicted phosphatase